MLCMAAFLPQTQSVLFNLRSSANKKRGLKRPLRAENGIRTRDPQLGKLMLYRLSYFRITEYKVTPFFLFVKFSAAEKCA